MDRLPSSNNNVLFIYPKLNRIRRLNLLTQETVEKVWQLFRDSKQPLDVILPKYVCSTWNQNAGIYLIINMLISTTSSI
jgi:hypothetical protein